MENNSSLFNLRKYDLMFKIYRNKIILIIIILAILMYFLFFSNLGNTPNSSEVENSNSYIGLLMSLLLFIFVILCVKYYYDNVLIINDDKEKIKDKPIPRVLKRKEVFNIPGNIYTYKQAKEVCNAYDARLANYEEVEKAYNDGAEWCNYGWSKDQSILFPTQKTTYNNLQKIKGHQHDCGRQGVNGGYMEDPELKFGVNCFGYKPNISLKEVELMKNTTPYPKTEEEKSFNADVDEIKKHLDDIIISPFNYKMWSRI
jgi:hypothetical protein